MEAYSSINFHKQAEIARCNRLPHQIDTPGGDQETKRCLKEGMDQNALVPFCKLKTAGASTRQSMQCHTKIEENLNSAGGRMGQFWGMSSAEAGRTMKTMSGLGIFARRCQHMQSQKQCLPKSAAPLHGFSG